MVTNLAIDYGAGISSAWTSIANFVPKLVAFLVILFIGWIIAKVVAKVIATVLNKIGFSRLTERSGLNDVLAKGNQDATTLLSKVVYFAILLIALQMAIGAFGNNPIKDLLDKLVAWLPKLFIALIIIVIVAAIAKAVKDLIQGALGKASYGPLVATAASVAIWGMGIVAALNQVGIATAVTTPVLITVLATVGGVIVVGVGGGLIRPMQDRWDGALNKLSDEAQTRRAERDQANASAAARGGQQRAYSAQQPGYGQPAPSHEQTQHFAAPPAQPPTGGQHQQPPQYGYGQPGGQHQQPGDWRQ